MNRTVRVGACEVDLDALAGIAHRYDPERCKARGCCCSTYEVTVGRREVERIVGCMGEAARFQPALREGDSFVHPFDEQGGGRFAIDTDEDGRCVFAYTDAAGETRCSIHSAALDMGLEPYKVKPTSCALWPLALGEGRPKRLGIQPGAFDFPCNRRRRPRRDGRLDEGVADLVRRNFGEAFLRRIEEAGAER